MTILAYGGVAVDATAVAPLGLATATSSEPTSSPAGILAGVVVLDVIRSPVSDFIANPRWCGMRIQLNTSDIKATELTGMLSIEESIDSAGRTAKFSFIGQNWGIPT